MANAVKLSAKIALDVVMFILLVLLYKAKVLTLTYHEVVGIGILLVFLIHCMFNWRWIANSTKKLFSPQIPARTKFSYWISVGLVISFLIIVISGVFISKVLFKEQIQALNIDTQVFMTLHLFFSAISLILVGIHLGFYWPMVKGFFRKKWNVSQKVAKPLCYVLLILIVGFGVYSVPTSGFGSWLLCPVIPIEHHHGDRGDKEGDDRSEEAEGSEESRSHEYGDGASAEDGEAGNQENREDGEQSDREAATSERSSRDSADGEQTDVRENGNNNESTVAEGNEREGRGERENAESSGDTNVSGERTERSGRGDREGSENADGEQTSERSGRSDRESADSGETESAEGSERSGRGDRETTETAEGTDETTTSEERSERGDREASDNAEGEETSERSGHGDRDAQDESADGSDERADREGGDREGADGDSDEQGQGEKKRSGNHGNNVEPLNIIRTICQFTSVVGLFAVITYYISEALRRRKSANKNKQ